jgi:hypothetical protein
MMRSARSNLKTFSVLAPLLALASTQAATAPGAELSLHASRTLSTSGPIADIERALLRLEHRAGQSRIAERARLGEMNARMENMGRTIAELQTLVVAAPSAPCLSTPVSVDPSVAATPTSGGAWQWLEWALIAGFSLMLGFLMRRPRTVAVETPIGMNSQTQAADQTTPPTATGTYPTLAHSTIQPHATERPATEPSEVDDTITDADLSLELADVMVSMGLGEGAVQTLEGHIRQHPRHALFHWLKLLEVYRRFGQHEEFEKAATELQRHFNIAPPPWHTVPPCANAPSLEDFPHISTRLQELWPRRSCAQYLNRLLEDNRNGARIGFPPPVVDESLHLLELLRA